MYKNVIETELVKIIEDLGIQKPKFTVEKPADEKFGDYATNLAMVLAKDLKKSPLEIAKEVAGKFPVLNFVERVEIEHPGFINFHLRKESLVANLNNIIQQAEKYGAADLGKSKKIVLEHTAVNPNKALHIGHLRSACLGSACEKILEFLGYEVEVEYYVDDTGVQVAVSALGVEELDIDPNSEEKYDHYAGRVYVMAMNALEEDKKNVMGSKGKLENKKNEIIKTLDRQEGEKLTFLRNFVENVIRANLETANIFNIDYDVLIWESDILSGKFWEKAFEIIKRSPNFYLAKTGKNKDCWVMKDFEVSQPNENSEIGREKVIVKSNGVVTYTGKDIAYHLWKFNLLEKDFKYKKWPTNNQKKALFTSARDGRSRQEFGRANLVLNFIDTRQSSTQQVVKNALFLMGFKEAAENLKHIAYGIVSLSPKTAKDLGIKLEEGKGQYAMSGRSGTVVLADDLLNLVKKKLKQKHPNAPEPVKIAAAAIKYHMLNHNTYSDIVFSYNRALDIYGNSGPYLQYTYARCQSVIRKAAKEKKVPRYIDEMKDIRLSKEETDVLRWIIHFPQTILESGKQYAPNLICNFLFELCSRFNTFYNKRPILKSKKGPESAQFRLLLTAATVQILGNGLRLLGIERPDRM